MNWLGAGGPMRPWRVGTAGAAWNLKINPNSEIRRREMMQDFERKSFEEKRGISEVIRRVFNEMLCRQKIALDRAYQFRSSGLIKADRDAFTFRRRHSGAFG